MIEVQSVTLYREQITCDAETCEGLHWTVMATLPNDGGSFTLWSHPDLNATLEEVVSLVEASVAFVVEDNRQAS